ncbi:MAG: PAS domain S-box protein [Bacteroidota bacterium]
MALSSPGVIRISAVIDRWIDPTNRPQDDQGLRRARMVVVEGWIALAALVTMSIALKLSSAPLIPVVQVYVSVVLSILALALVRNGGRIQAAAWILTIILVLTPIFQASVDLGIRDPTLALVLVAPLAGAITSGARLAAASAVIGSLGATVLFILDLSGLAPSPYTPLSDVGVYGLTTVVFGSTLTATAGALYARHTSRHIIEVEDESTRLDAALRESEQRYQSLFEHIPIGMYQTAADGQILLANSALARLIGASSIEEARASNAIDFYKDPADRDRFRRLILRDGAVKSFETSWKRPDGSTRYVRLDARVALDDNGDPLYYEGAVEDITTEREALVALRRNEARFRALVQDSSDVVVVTDRQHRLTYVSPAISRLLGRDPDPLIGTPLVELVHPDDVDTAQTFLQRAEDGSAADQVELRLLHADLHSVFVEGAATELYDDPAVEGLVLNLRDATERKRAQAVLIQAKQQAEQIAAMKSTFIANMSHEIRTPLTAILGFADVLGEEVEDPDQSQFVSLIAQSGKRLMDTLNSVLDIARLEADGGSLSEERIDAGDLVRETVAMFGPAASEKQLSISSEVEDGEHPIIADEGSLVRVLHNLVGNALKFTDEGSVTVGVRTDTGEAGARVLLTVRDTGVGIDPAFLPRIFGAFEQESGGSGRRYEGAGLGLSLAHQLVERMNGTVTVQSEKGAGTEFTVSFPAVSGTYDDDVRPLILVVDDNEQARMMAVHTLAGTYRTRVTLTGEDALASIDEERPDAVLLDIHLGLSISGEDVMRRIRASKAHAPLPIIAVTAYALPGDRDRFLSAGFDAYVTKPYTRSELLAAVSASLRTSASDSGGPAGDAPGGATYLVRSSDPTAPADASAPASEQEEA